MTCTKIRVFISGYLDDILDAPAKTSVEAHLAECPGCAGYLRSLDALRSQMRSLGQPAFPRELVSAILGERDVPGRSSRSRSSGTLPFRVLDFGYYRPGAMASVASFLITCTMYGALLGYLKPIPPWTVPGRLEPIVLTSKQFSDLNERGAVTGGGEYTLPRVVSTARLGESLRDAPNRAIVVVTLINTDGRASVLEVLTPRDRPDVAAQVAGALQDISFRPATTAGRPVATQLILMLEKIDVRG